MHFRPRKRVWADVTFRPAKTSIQATSPDRLPTSSFVRETQRPVPISIVPAFIDKAGTFNGSIPLSRCIACVPSVVPATWLADMIPFN